jgi:ABC-type sugar transport system substrate-binding protein
VKSMKMPMKAGPKSLRRPALTGVAIGALFIVLAACGSSSSGSSAPTSPAASTGGSVAPASSAPTTTKYTVGIMINDTTNPFLSAMGKSFTATAKGLGMNVDLLNGAGDISTQISDVSDLLAKHVNALVLTPSDPTAILPAVKNANQANVPVFDLNSAISPGAKLVTYIGDSDYQYGVDEGNMAAQAIHGKGNVAVLLGVLGDAPEVDRLAGIKAAFKKYPDIKIVTTEVDDWDNSKNLADVQDLLAKYPKGTLQAIIAQGPEMYVGAAYAAKHGRSDVKFIAGDYSTQVEQAIKAGQLYGTVNQSPVLEGKLAAQAAFDWLSGKKSDVKTPNDFVALPLVTAKNVASFPAEWSG